MRGMLRNIVKTPYGNGMPINSYQYKSDSENVRADFGASASMLYLLWYLLENVELSYEWKNSCLNGFKTLLNFCLNVFDKSEFYILPHSENNSKILLLPIFLKKEELESSKQIIDDIKNCIKNEIELRNNKLTKNLKKIYLPPELICLRKIIELWKIPKYWEKQSRWDFVSTVFSSSFGEFVGGILKSLVSS